MNISRKEATKLSAPFLKVFYRKIWKDRYALSIAHLVGSIQLGINIHWSMEFSITVAVGPMMVSVGII